MNHELHRRYLGAWHGGWFVRAEALLKSAPKDYQAAWALVRFFSRVQGPYWK